ncbi:SDR family oxidoreductase [Rudanella paleaurantiibacter]|uniref:SDR family oxidoreductase n=1 Tax=Rudanella paleaurantiibacter TaxID=2614655 RepID=A0A7J5U698_9BACT|nr:SDR family oxidoreductase [Rudanella paleaurantiibacter]KAB7733107.1 SDR family oxidoreductase [Rudanella paleaurantiibacter]
MPFTIDLSDKVVLLTGSTAGIGLGIARQFARAGAHVAGCGLEAIEQAREFIQTVQSESGQTPLYVQADVTQPDDLARLVSETVARYGRIDILASNAGTNVFAGVDGCSEAEWEINLNLNLASHWRLARLCKPYLEAAPGGGIIVVNASCHAYSSLPGCFPYNVTKTALMGLVRSLTLEWSPTIRTVGVAPGFIDTRLNEAWFDTFPDPAAERARTEAQFPMRRLGTPDEIGGWFVFLASDYARFSAGQTYLIDGGRSVVMM